jgi:hypothetical protein
MGHVRTKNGGGKERHRMLTGKTGGHYLGDLFVHEIIILKLVQIK